MDALRCDILYNSVWVFNAEKLDFHQWIVWKIIIYLQSYYLRSSKQEVPENSAQSSKKT